MKSWRVAVVVPARGVKWLSRPTAVTCSRGRPRISAVMEQSEEVCPPPTSGAAQRTTAVPSSSMPTHAEAESRVQHMRPYGVKDAAEPSRDSHRPVAGPHRTEGLPRAPHGLAQHGLALQHLAGGDAVTLAQEILLAQQERIHADGPRQRIHLPFVGDAGLDGPEGAIGARDGIVGVHGEGVHLHVGHAIGAGGRHEAVEEHPRGEGGVGAGVRDHLRLHGHQLTAPRRARLVAQHVGMALAVADEALFAGEHELDGPPRLPHEEAEQAFDGHVLLAAEAAAQIGALQTHAAVGQPQHLGHVAEVLEHLRAHAQDEHAFRVDPADARLRLQVEMIDEGRPVRLLDHHLGPREAPGRYRPCGCARRRRRLPPSWTWGASGLQASSGS